MTAALIDSNVLMTSRRTIPTGPAGPRTLERIGPAMPLVINPIIWSEVSIAFDRVADWTRKRPSGAIRCRGTRGAGRASLAYRRRGGPRSTPLPDFYIGAHAAVSHYTLVTRHRSRFATYFPTVEIASP